MRDGRIGPFSVIAKLGGGGMSDVYLATREGPADFLRPVVVKVLRAELQRDDEFQRMFIDEARLSSRIQHTNVVVVEDLGEDDGRLYMVMEYVHGVALSELLPRLAGLRRHLSPATAVAIAAQALAGLRAAHEARGPDGAPLNLVHRDISPQNVLLAANGVVKLIDFGIAKAAQRLHRTMGHVIKGKLRYMAPEQIAGEVDQRTDLHAVGIVLWEMLTGRRLFGEEDDAQVIARVRAGAIDPPSRYADVPPALEALLMRTLAVDPARRPGSAKELRRALLQAVPEARQVEPPALSALLVATVGPELEDRARRFMVPMDSGLNTTELSSEPVRALEALTLPWEAVAAAPSAAGATVAQRPRRSSGVAAPPSTLAAGATVAQQPPGTSAPPGSGPATAKGVQQPSAPPPRRSPPLWPWAVAGALVTTAAIGALAFLPRLWTDAAIREIEQLGEPGGEGTPPEVVTPLASPIPARQPRPAPAPPPVGPAAVADEPASAPAVGRSAARPAPTSPAPVAEPRARPSRSEGSRMTRARRREAFPLVTDQDPFADDF